MIRWETVNQTAQRLHVSRRSIYRLIDAGLPTSTATGRVLLDPDAVDRFITNPRRQRRTAA